MIKLEKTEVFGFEVAIRGLRNPFNSWDNSDSNTCEFYTGLETEHCATCPYINSCNADDSDIATKYLIGPKDHERIMKLVKAGPVHAKFRRMIVVYVDITAPLYWWKEFDTYKVGTVANSCSTMHKIADKEFTLDDFSHEHLLKGRDLDISEFAIYQNDEGGNERWSSLDLLYFTIKVLNHYRDLYLKTKDKKYWWQLIQLLPSSFNQKRTVMLNYEVLSNIYKPDSRLHHKLDEWSIDGSGESLCKWIETLPYSEIITGKK